MSGARQRRLDVILRPLLEEVTSQLMALPNRHASHECFDLGDLPDRIAAEMPAAHRLQRALLSIAGHLIDIAKPDEPAHPQALMRDLTGAWLGLYFLGAPFPHPWEPVARHAERNGYYQDGGIFKAAGDVYRAARKDPRHSSGSAADDLRLVVFDLNPLAFNRLVAKKKIDGGDLSDHVKALGACYEMLQLRLYIEAGRPIEHVILEDTLVWLCGGNSAKDEIEPLVELATRVYGRLLPPKSGQSISIVLRSHADHAKLKQMSGCVLAPNAGVYRSRLAGHGGANGNRLTTPQHELYRRTLLEALESKSGLKLVTDASDLSKYLRGLQGPGPATGGQVLAAPPVAAGTTSGTRE